MQKAVIYARYSSHNQREESIEQQIAECKAYAKANGMTVIAIYSDSAVTGRTDRRPQFQRLQRDAKKQGFSYIIAYKSNRIARNLLNALTFENDMEKLGIQVQYAKEEFGNTPAGRFALRMMMNVNQFYSENLGEDIKRNQAANAQECKANGPASYGYKTGPDGKFEIDEDTSPVVQEIFSRVSCGETFADIQNDFNLRGIKTRRGGMWNKSSFASILKNERYIGVYLFDGVRIEGGMPSIISKELFYKVQDQLKNKKNPQGSHRENGDYILTGKLFCGECKSHMIGMSGTSKSGALYQYYVCNEKRLKGACKKKNIKRDYIESEIARAICEHILKDDTIEWITDKTMQYQEEHKNAPELILLKDQISDTEKAIKNLLSAIEQGIVTDSTKSRLLELEKQHAELNIQLSAVDAESLTVTREQVIKYLCSFKNGKLEDKNYQKTLFDKFLRAAYLYDDGRVKLIFNLFGESSHDIKYALSCLEDNETDVRLPSDVGHQKDDLLRQVVFFCEIVLVSKTIFDDKTSEPFNRFGCFVLLFIFNRCYRLLYLLSYYSDLRHSSRA